MKFFLILCLFVSFVNTYYSQTNENNKCSIFCQSTVGNNSLCAMYNFCGGVIINHFGLSAGYNIGLVNNGSGINMAFFYRASNPCKIFSPEMGLRIGNYKRQQFILTGNGIFGANFWGATGYFGFRLKIFHNLLFNFESGLGITRISKLRKDTNLIFPQSFLLTPGINFGLCAFFPFKKPINPTQKENAFFAHKERPNHTLSISYSPSRSFDPTLYLNLDYAINLKKHFQLFAGPQIQLMGVNENAQIEKKTKLVAGKIGLTYFPTLYRNANFYTRFFMKAGVIPNQKYINTYEMVPYFSQTLGAGFRFSLKNGIFCEAGSQFTHWFFSNQPFMIYSEANLAVGYSFGSNKKAKTALK